MLATKRLPKKTGGRRCDAGGALQYNIKLGGDLEFGEGFEIYMGASRIPWPPGGYIEI